MDPIIEHRIQILLKEHTIKIIDYLDNYGRNICNISTFFGSEKTEIDAIREKLKKLRDNVEIGKRNKKGK